MRKKFAFIIYLSYIVTLSVAECDNFDCENSTFNDTDVNIWAEIQKSLIIREETNQISIGLDSNSKGTIQDHLKGSPFLCKCVSDLRVSVSVSSIEKYSLFVPYQKLGQDLNIPDIPPSCSNFSVNIESYFDPHNSSLSNSPFVMSQSIMTVPNMTDLNFTTELTTSTRASLVVYGLDPNCNSNTTFIVVDCPKSALRFPSRFEKQLLVGPLCPGTTDDCKVGLQQLVNLSWRDEIPMFNFPITTKEPNLTFSPKSHEIEVHLPTELSPPIYLINVLSNSSSSTMINGSTYRLTDLIPNQEYEIVLNVSIIRDAEQSRCGNRKTWLIRTVEAKPEGSPIVLEPTRQFGPTSIEVEWDYKNVIINGNLTKFKLVYQRKCNLDGEERRFEDEQEREIDGHETKAIIPNLTPYSKYEVKVALSNTAYESDLSSPVLFETAPCIKVTQKHLNVIPLDFSVKIVLDLEPELYYGKINVTLFRKNERYGGEKSFQLNHSSFQTIQDYEIDVDIQPCMAYQFCMNLTLEHGSEVKMFCADKKQIPTNVPRPPLNLQEYSLNQQNFTFSIKTTDVRECRPDVYEITWKSVSTEPQQTEYCKWNHGPKTWNVSVTDDETTHITVPNLPSYGNISFEIRGYNEIGPSEALRYDKKTPPSLRDVEIGVKPLPSPNTIDLSSLTICPHQGPISSELTCRQNGTTKTHQCQGLEANKEYEFCVTVKLVQEQAISSHKEKTICQNVLTTCNELGKPKASLIPVSPMEARFPFNPFLQTQVKLPANTFIDNLNVIELELNGATSESAIPLNLTQDLFIKTSKTLKPGQTVELSVKAKGCKNNQFTKAVSTHTEQIQPALIQIDVSWVNNKEGQCKVNISELIMNLCFLRDTTYQIGMSVFSVQNLFETIPNIQCVGQALWKRVNKSGIVIEFDSSVSTISMHINYTFEGQNLWVYTNEIELPAQSSLFLVVGTCFAMVALFVGLLYWFVKCNGSKKTTVFTANIKEWIMKPESGPKIHPEREVELTPIVRSVPSSSFALGLFDQLTRSPDFDPNVEYLRIESWDREVNVPQTSQSFGKSVPRTLSGASLNRYSNIIPYNHNRVILNTGVEGQDYVNASWIRDHSGERRFIATQGPLPETRQAFWQMILDQNVKLIVMVTKLKEGGKCKQIHLDVDNCSVYL